ncbi:hypothetical protein [Streptomyces sp. NPDC054787]
MSTHLRALASTDEAVLAPTDEAAGTARGGHASATGSALEKSLRVLEAVAAPADPHRLTEVRARLCPGRRGERADHPLRRRRRPRPGRPPGRRASVTTVTLLVSREEIETYARGRASPRPLL